MADLPVQPTDCPADIIFVLDKSGSIHSSDFDLTKSFLSRLVNRLDIDSGKTRVGLVTYATNIGSGFNLSDHSSVAAVQAAISALSYTGGNTNTAAALAHVRRSMLTAATGDRSNVSNVVVVLTDGRSNNKSATQVCVNVKVTYFVHLPVQLPTDVIERILFFAFVLCPCMCLGHC